MLCSVLRAGGSSMGAGPLLFVVFNIEAFGWVSCRAGPAELGCGGARDGWCVPLCLRARQNLPHLFSVEKTLRGPGEVFSRG